MAGQDDVNLEQKKHSKINCLLNTWFLDWVCYNAWLEFHESRSVDKQNLRDLIQGVICRPFLKARKHVKQKVRLLMILCRLVDGEDYEMQYFVNSNLTVLEDMLDIFRSLIIEEDELAEEGNNQIPSIKAEAVFVCCRQNDFKTARKIFQRQWPMEERTDNICAVIEDVIKFKNPEHQYLQDYTYESFVNSIALYLEKIYSKFGIPYIYKIAESCIECSEVLVTSNETNRNNSSEETTPRKYDASVMKKAVDMRGIRKTSDQDVRPSTSGLEAVRKQTVSDVQSTIGKSKTCKKLPQSTTPTRVLNTTPTRVPNTTPTRVPNTTPTRVPNTTPTRVPNTTPTRVPNTNVFKIPDRPVYTDSCDIANRRNGTPSSLPKRQLRNRKNNNQQDRHNASSTASLQRPSSPDSNSSDFGDEITVSTVSGSPMKVGSRKRRNWAEKEINDFYDAVCKIGVGKWAEIRDFLKTDRTGVDLKDKWRNLLKTGQIEDLMQDRWENSKKKK